MNNSEKKYLLGIGLFSGIAFVGSMYIGKKKNRRNPTKPNTMNKQFRNRRVIQVENLCKKYNIPYRKHTAQTGTVYFTFEIGRKEIKYRISDHSDAHGTATYNTDYYSGDDYFKVKDVLVKHYKPIYEAELLATKVKNKEIADRVAAFSKTPSGKLKKIYSDERNYDLVQIVNLLQTHNGDKEKVISAIKNDVHDSRSRKDIEPLIKTVLDDLKKLT